jgi:hypothetical protein
VSRVAAQGTTLNARQWATLSLFVALIAAWIGVDSAGGPHWVVTVLVGLVMFALMTCVFVVLIPVVRARHV